MFNPETLLGDRPSERVARLAWLDAVASRVQPPVLAWRDGLPRALKNAIHGSPLGHPLHPALTDVPVGAWTVTAVLDALTLAGSDTVAAASDVSLAVGMAGAVAAIVTGLAEWSDTSDRPRSLGMAHAILNSAAFGAYGAALALRRTGRRRAGIGVAFVGYGLVAAASYLGGELSFGMQIGVRHTGIPLTPPDDFVAVMSDADLALGAMRRVEAAGIPIVLVRTEAGLFALAAACTHRGAPLEEGTLDGACVRCPWHASAFALADGAVVEGPASFPQARFEVRVRAGHIEVRAPA